MSVPVNYTLRFILESCHLLLIGKYKGLSYSSASATFNANCLSHLDVAFLLPQIHAKKTLFMLHGLEVIIIEEIES